jgi:ABC-type transport system involved in multi-copper enzyme maturation permease subunit
VTAAIGRIALLTMHEMVRRRLVVVTLILTAAIAAMTGWGFHTLTVPHHGRVHSHGEVLQIAATMLMLVAYMFNLIFALGGAFLAAPALANEVESGLLLPVLTRPVSRVEIVIGKFVGLALLLAAYAYIAGLLEFGIAYAVTGYWPPHPIAALGYLTGVALVMLAVTLAIGSRLPAIASGVAAVVLYGVAWICGVVGDLGVSAHSETFTHVGTISHLVLPSDTFWRAAVFRLEPAAFVAGVHGSAPFFATASPPGATIAWSVLWIVAMVAIACVSFSARDV